MKAKKQNSKNFSAFSIVILVLLLIYTFTLFIALFWGIGTSLKSEDDFLMSKNILGFPSLDKNDPFNSRATFFTLSNYVEVIKGFTFPVSSAYLFNGQNIMRYETVNIATMFTNTLLYAGVLCVIRAFMPALVAYLCTKFNYKFNAVFIAGSLFVMTLPTVAIDPSQLALQQKLGLYDTLIGHYIQNLDYTGMYFIVFLGYFKNIPNTYSEAAEIDGASQFTILTKIILPISIKVISTVMLIQFVNLWNNYQTPILYLPTHPTLAYGVYYLVYSQGDRSLATTPHMVAGCMMLMIPILTIFIIFKERVMGNMTVGGVKE